MKRGMIMTLLQKASCNIFPNKYSYPKDKPPMNTVIPDLCLEKYENRSQEIQNSTEPIEGIFFIYGNKIIPDYYTECLESESVCMNCWRSYRDIRQQMYLETFYHNYMIYKYPELKYISIGKEKHLPRGRTSVYFTDKTLLLDKCYINNIEILDQIFKLYRLPSDTMIIPCYTCSNCISK